MNNYLILKNGYQMPILGLGTYNLDKTLAKELIMKALKLGYRHLETAPIYLNEEAIGQAIKASGVDRHQIFITSKIPPHIKNFQSALRFAEKSMKNLGVDYLDALLINNPVPWGEEGKDYSKENLEVWQALEKLYADERVGSIGVSNFSVEDLQQLLPYVQVVPHINQLGIFVGHTLDDLRSFCRYHHIIIQGHSPLARGRIFNIHRLHKLANQYGVSPAQIALKYVMEKGVCPIVKASSMEHLKENLRLDFLLSKKSILELDAIKKDVRDYKPPKAKYIL
ncbi:MAG TPA: aldo/keto reductase [Candidatus Izemoplasmatales bacterium]|nr:aldo/keto reductase [Candidatus Izemoplasmatales bacterium]